MVKESSQDSRSGVFMETSHLEGSVLQWWGGDTERMNAYQFLNCIKALFGSLELPLGGNVSLKAFRHSSILVTLTFLTLDGA